MAAKKLRYTITRLCLDDGSIALLKYLEPFIPAEGPFSFICENGKEIKTTTSPDGRIRGFGDYFRAQGLAVNDALFITPLDERKLQLEAMTKHRDAPPRVQSAALAKPVTERIVEHESDYIREVRIAPVSPYPNGILYPQQQQQQTQASIEAVSPASRGALMPPAKNAPVSAEEKPVQSASPVVQPAPSSPVARAADVFARLGYEVKKLEGGLLLETRLGRLGHKVGVGFEGSGADAVLKSARVQGVKYLAVVASKERIGLVNPVSPFGRVARVELEALETLDGLATRFNITPLELEGYWNAEGISGEALESLQENATSRLESKGVFSYVLLSLRHFEAPCILTPEDVCAKLPGSGVTTGTVIDVLETLCKAPFNILSSVGIGEYHLKTPLERALSELSDYVSSLRMHLRGSGVSRADAVMTTQK
jgi:hypothetical protein